MYQYLPNDQFNSDVKPINLNSKEIEVVGNRIRSFNNQEHKEFALEILTDGESFLNTGSFSQDDIKSVMMKMKERGRIDPGQNEDNIYNTLDACNIHSKNDNIRFYLSNDKRKFTILSIILSYDKYKHNPNNFTEGLLETYIYWYGHGVASQPGAENVSSGQIRTQSGEFEYTFYYEIIDQKHFVYDMKYISIRS